jgi:hypothetical protein
MPISFSPRDQPPGGVCESGFEIASANSFSLRNVRAPASGQLGRLPRLGGGGLPYCGALRAASEARITTMSFPSPQPATPYIVAILSPSQFVRPSEAQAALTDSREAPPDPGRRSNQTLFLPSPGVGPLDLCQSKKCLITTCFPSAPSI